MDETSDLSFAIGFIVAALVLVSVSAGIGYWYADSQHKYGCSPEVLIAYTEGYQECKAGK